MQPDLTQNIQEGIYLLFAHNADMIAYVSGIALCGMLTFLRPSRLSLWFTLGFIVLAVSFFYDKHVSEPLINQTLATVVGSSQTGHFTIRKGIDFFFSILLPAVFFVSGWLVLFSGITYCIWRAGKKKSQ